MLKSSAPNSPAICPSLLPSSFCSLLDSVIVRRRTTPPACFQPLLSAMPCLSARGMAFYCAQKARRAAWEDVSERQLRYHYINIEHLFAITIAFPKKVCYSKRVQQQQKNGIRNVRIGGFSMKKFMLFVLALLLLCSTLVPAQASDFSLSDFLNSMYNTSSDTMPKNVKMPQQFSITYEYVEDGKYREVNNGV